MKILDAHRRRRSGGGVLAANAGSPESDLPPIPGYDQLDKKKVSAQLHQLSQVELAAVERYERSHKDRPEVLNKLRYMRTGEPLPGYDALSLEEIAEGLAAADAETVKAVRDYERKFAHRRQVCEEAARALQTAPASAAEVRAREEQDTLVREGFAGRAKTAGGLDRGREPRDRGDRV